MLISASWWAVLDTGREHIVRYKFYLIREVIVTHSLELSSHELYNFSKGRNWNLFYDNLKKFFLRRYILRRLNEIFQIFCVKHISNQRKHIIKNRKNL